MTTVEDLIGAGDELARRCVLLGPDYGGETIGYWGGEREDRPNEAPAGATALASWTHLLTIDSGLLSGVGIAVQAPALGLFVVEDVDGNSSLRLEMSSTQAFPELICSGEPLSATFETSFPPFEALCLYGGAAVQAWLRSLGLRNHQYDLAVGETIAGDYADHYLHRSQFHAGEADALLGGWHLRWPEDDFYLPLEMRLVLTSIRDAEPFWEAWQSGAGHFSTRERIT